MHGVMLGLTALVILAVCVGATPHWAAGVAVIVVLITITYFCLKLSPSYRQTCDQRVEAAATYKPWIAGLAMALSLVIRAFAGRSKS